MHCPRCQFENPDEKKFCRECGAKLILACPQCAAEILSSDKFCGECGYDLNKSAEATPPGKKEHGLQIPKSPSEKTITTIIQAEGERKHVTVLFSDITGYTAMCERLDPEEVKEITGKFFDEVSKIISKYEGFVEKFAGDAVMALFGATEAHEDDPVRAILAGREIHNLVKSLRPKYEKLIEQPLLMHTGINTGLVVTGEINLEKGVHGVAGDTINVAARLSNHGNADEIIVGSDTFRQAEGFFSFEKLEPVKLKGKTESIQIYKVLKPREKPIKIHRLQGLRAELIGRKVEMDQLTEALGLLKDKKGSIISICGSAGTGKSRLVEEFKASMNLEEMQWLEGYAYPYSQNISYSPLIDLLNNGLQIKEGDPPDVIREKVESGISDIVGLRDDVVPYIGSLFSLSYPEIDEVSPDFWKSQLQKAIQTTLSALAQRAPTIICLEDLHWSDPSFLELLRQLLPNFREQILFLCVYRPSVSLFTRQQINAMSTSYQEIRLQDLSPSESQIMVESLLKTNTIPADLGRFVRDKVQGNPFYIEEIINSLIESETLVRENGGWQICRPFSESEISTTIYGVISGRLDRLEESTKRVLQEASVIGRSFFYEILNRISELTDRIDLCLTSLERLDLIKLQTLQPDLEYMFKHALTQEVVYNGLLKKERQAIHERIGLVIEEVFKDRLPEFYETLAYHFKEGQSLVKAVSYLMRSGDKSVRRFALEESHRCYQEAFDLLISKVDKSKKEEELIIDLLIKWAYVYYYRGDFKALVKLLIAHEKLAESLDNKVKLGMFYAWLGFALEVFGRPRESFDYLSSALKIGEKANDQLLLGFTYAWLAFTCMDLGNLHEGVRFGEKAQEICQTLDSDHYIYIFFKSLNAIAQISYFTGDKSKAFEAGKSLIECGEKKSNIRSQSLGHICLGLGHMIDGDFSSAIKSSKKAEEVSVDPVYYHYAKLVLAMSYIQTNKLLDAERILQKVVPYSKQVGYDIVGLPAKVYLAVIQIANGKMQYGMNMIEECLRDAIKNGKRAVECLIEYIIGKVYLQMVEGTEPVSWTLITKNIGFLVKALPFAAKKAERHLNRAIEIATEISANFIIAQAKLELSLLHKAKKRTDKAKQCLSEAIKIFEQCEADLYQRQANEALASLK